MRFLRVLAIVLLLVVHLPLLASGADQVKLKHIASSYTDTAEVGLKFPEGVACSDPHLFVADTGNRRLLRYAYQESALLVDKVIELDQSIPLQVQVNSSSEVYLLDGRDRRIVMLDQGGNLKASFSFKGIPTGKQVVPKSFRVDGRDNLVILDIFSERVLIVDGSGAYQTQIAFPKEYGFFSDLEVDTQGNIFLLDSVNAAVYKSFDGTEFKLFSAEIEDYLNFPTSLTVNQRGQIFLVDQYGSGLALLAADGTFSGRKVGMGWEDGFLYYPAQACFNSAGDLFIADRNNSRIQQFTQVE